MPSNSGNLPLHYCVSRAKPSIPIIKALFNAYPEGIRSGCEEGYLPLHRFLNRSIVDLEALRQLINYFPDALLAKSTQRGQTPLHVALDNHVPDALAVELLLQVRPVIVYVLVIHTFFCVKRFLFSCLCALFEKDALSKMSKFICFSYRFYYRFAPLLRR